MPGDSRYTQNDEGWKPSSNPNKTQSKSGQGPVFYPKQPQQPPSPPQTPVNTENNGADSHMPTEFFSDETQVGIPLNEYMPTLASQQMQPGYQTPGAPQPTQYQQNQPGQQPLHGHALGDAARLALYSNIDPVPPGPPHSKIATLWKRDPAYRVLFVAIGVVLLCCLGGSLLLVSAFGHAGQGGQGGQGGQQANSNVSGASTSNTPTVPTPDPKKQLQATALAATATALAVTPTPMPSPTPVPSPTPPPPTPTPTLNNNGPLSVQINNLPGSANNHSTVPVTVTANHPGTTVRLVVYYSGAQPSSYNSGSQSVDASGNTTFYWNIDEQRSRLFGNTVIARVMVVAQDQNGNVTNSSIESVQINMGH